jgi:hypothetical protein
MAYICEFELIPLRVKACSQFWPAKPADRPGTHRLETKYEQRRTASGPMQKALCTELLYIQTTVPLAAGVWTMPYWCSGALGAPAGPNSLKFSPVCNNRWPDAQSALHGAFIHLVHCPARALSFWRFSLSAGAWVRVSRASGYLKNRRVYSCDCSPPQKATIL